ncbi:Aste57867_21979 [Aphanomyces stellatus]|uniref:Aste57867_21979 protein n=1 Tax=Aphanomyces stellatus TaxID=120398 RepID=A0A485LNV2_9STRA|nr:hypothetical protein As57867_021910 [Aphanomyces stellatus]VFT98647.1 Aste57867_21979 [Aphanomyces stellatus]
MASLLEKYRLQNAAKVLAFQQDMIRSQIRMEGEHKRDKPYSPTLSPDRGGTEVEGGWIRLPPPKYNGQPISSYPKTRECWSTADFTTMSTRQLRAVADLLGIDLDGKKVALVARLQDWINEAAILAHRRRIERESRKREKVEASGGVFGFGNNFAGQLGLGHRDPKDVPTELMALKGHKIVKVFTGFDADYAFALSSTGEVYSWGGNGVGPTAFAPSKSSIHDQRNNATSDDDDGGPHVSDPEATTFLFPSVVRVLRVEDVESIAMARALGHVAAITKSGQCFTWGKNDYGELGVGHVQNNDTTVSPRPLDSLGNAMVVAIGVGNSHTIASTDAGKCYVWGAAWGGQLGLGVTKREGVTDRKLQMCYPAPTLLQLPVRVAHVSCGAAHSGLISTTGELFTFGCGDGGRLGLGSNADTLSPTVVSSLQKDRVLQVFCSNWHTLCIAAPRQLSGHAARDSLAGWAYAFGSGLNGQLGLGKQKQALLPTKIPELMKRKMKCIDVKASSYHSCALAEDGTVFTWGRNMSGCLGRFSQETDSYEPDVVAQVKTWGYGPVTSVSCGCRFTLLVAAPWKGITKPAYAGVQELNSRLKTTVGAPDEFVIED